MPTAIEAKPKKVVRDYSDIAKRYSKGARIVDLAAEYGISRVGMYQQLQKHGVTDFRDDRKKLDPAEAIDMYKQGMTMTAIAKHYNCTVGAISMLFKKYGVPTRDKAILPDLESIDVVIPDVKKDQREAFKSFQKDFIKQLADDRSVFGSLLDDGEDDNLAETAAFLSCV